MGGLAVRKEGGRAIDLRGVGVGGGSVVVRGGGWSVE